MGHLGFYLDSQACIGCKACQMACKDKNDLEVGELFRVVYDVEGDVEVALLPSDTTGASFVVNPHEHAPKTDEGSWTLTSLDFEV